MSQHLPPHDEMHSRETEFHDEWARSVDLAAIDVRAAFESPAAMENRFILGLMGPLRNKRILDVGSGLGESSVYFALQGAHVTCTDLSPGMVQTAIELAAMYGVTVNGVVCPAEQLLVEPESFDFVYAANVLHHVSDKRAMLTSIKRALKPGGTFFSIDPLLYNPAIGVYRLLATDVRSDDEAPLGHSDLRLVRQFFPGARHREFWLLTLALFFKYFLVDRVHPNQDRYWKRIFTETPSTLRWWLPLRAADGILCRIPLLNWLSWNIVMWGTK